MTTMDMRLSKTVANASTLDLWLSLISLPSALPFALCFVLLLLYCSLSLCGETGRLSGEARDESTHVRIDTDAILITV